jgi:hypothetical protein
MADVMQINPTLLKIELVEHAIVADAKFKLWSSSQSLVSKSGQAKTHLIDFALDRFTGTDGQTIECFAECRRPDLQRRGPKLLCATFGVIARSDVGPRLIKLGFDLVRQL